MRARRMSLRKSRMLPTTGLPRGPGGRRAVGWAMLIPVDHATRNPKIQPQPTALFGPGRCLTVSLMPEGLAGRLLDAYGGEDRWRSATAVEAHLTIGGLLFRWE